MTKKGRTKYPKSFGASKVKRVLDYYENQSDADAAKEIDTAPAVDDPTWMLVPASLVPQVRKLIAHRKRSA
jgi:hypothetical protein